MCFNGGVEGWRTFDHTGDLGLEVWAASPERLFGLAAEALLALVIETTGRPPERSARLSLEGDDPADLLVHWLNSVLLEAEVRQVVWTRANIERLEPRALQGLLEGVDRDVTRQTFLREIKAVSHHDLFLRLDPPECRCRLVLDI